MAGELKSDYSEEMVLRKMVAPLRPQRDLNSGIPPIFFEIFLKTVFNRRLGPLVASFAPK